MAALRTILIPTRPQPDTVVAIFLLKQFGQKHFPDIQNARIEVKHQLAPTDTFETLTAQGILPLDLGGGALDHHGKPQCTTQLVAAYLAVERDPALRRLIQYAERDDKQGKGIISNDPIDRAFGLSGLIASLNKTHPQNPQLVVDVVLPLLAAHYAAAREHHVELPQEVERKKREGNYLETTVRQGDKTLRMVCIASDKPSMPTFLRSQQGPMADIVVQKSEATNHFCILTNQKKAVDLSKVMSLIRLREAQLMGVELVDDPEYLGQTGRIAEIEHWYFDPATISLLNGGQHNTAIAESRIPWEEMQRIVKVGLEMGSAPVAPSSYYLSLNIPEETAQQILSNLLVPKAVKKHAAANLHITLEHFGEKSAAEAEAIALELAGALSTKEKFRIILKDSQLASGAPEGYSNTQAWYLDVNNTTNADLVHDLRRTALGALGLPDRDKALHITLAQQRDRATAVDADEVSFKNSFEIEAPVGELVLMESAKTEKGREYHPFATFVLQ